MFVCGSMSLMAQVAQEQDVSDKELGQFADAYTEVQMENQKSQQKMIARSCRQNQPKRPTRYRNANGNKNRVRRSNTPDYG